MEHDEDGTYRHHLGDFLQSTGTYREKVSLLFGSPLNKRDLLRVEIQTASAVFFVPNKFSCHLAREDAANILRVCAIRRYKGPMTQMFALCLNSDNRVVFEASGIPRDHLIASDQIKMGQWFEFLKILSVINLLSGCGHILNIEPFDILYVV